MTTVSVVIPARESQSTIRATVDSLYNQTRKPDEIVIVVNVGDETKNNIKDYIEEGFVKIVEVNPPDGYVRDAQYKRWVGCQNSKGEVIFLTDSKVIVEKNAISNAIELMVNYGVSIIAGITPGWPEQRDNFWAKLHDKALISNLPEFCGNGYITKQNFGNTESLPVTSVLFITRGVFEDVFADFALEFSKFASTYDDYVLSWLIAKAGYTILTTNRVVVYHYHRTSWKEYSKQITRSGQSAAVMTKMYQDCPFGMRRLKQVFLVLVGTFLLFEFFIGSFLSSELATVCISIAFTITVALGIANVIKAKDWRAFVFPILSALLILNFSLHFTKTYIQKAYKPSNVVKYLQIH